MRGGGFTWGIILCLISIFHTICYSKFKVNTARLFIFGLISGILSVWLMALFAPVSRGSQWSLYFVPGIVFGLTISIYFRFFRNNGELTINKICFWILTSAIAYNLAVGSVFSYFTITQSFFSGSMTLPLFLAGMIGGGLMLIGYRLFLFPLSIRELFVLTVFAGILGGLISMVEVGPNIFFNLYIVWQSGMALALGALMDRRGMNSQATTELGQQEVKPEENITQ